MTSYPLPYLLSAALVLAGGTEQLSRHRNLLQAEVALSTQSADKIAEQLAAKTLEHDTEVSRTDSITAMVRIASCEKDARGVCNASADVVVYRPDGSVSSEIKQLPLSSGRATTAIALSGADVPGLYRIVATVRDLNARKFATTERIFGVKE